MRHMDDVDSDTRLRYRHPEAFWTCGSSPRGQSVATALDRLFPATKVNPVTFKGNGLSREFEDASWDKSPHAIYS